MISVGRTLNNLKLCLCKVCINPQKLRDVVTKYILYLILSGRDSRHSRNTTKDKMSKKKSMGA